MQIESIFSGGSVLTFGCTNFTLSEYGPYILFHYKLDLACYNDVPWGLWIMFWMFGYDPITVAFDHRNQYFGIFLSLPL